MDCVLRRWEKDDDAALVRWLNNPKILNNLRDGLPNPYTLPDAQEYIAAMLAADENTTIAFAIAVDGQAVGSIGAFRKENIHDYTAEIGYYLAEPFWGKGLATSAVKQIGRHIFTKTNILRIFAEPFARNVGSCRVLEKAGFVLEGNMRSNAIKNGIVEDMKLYSLLKTDAAAAALLE